MTAAFIIVLLGAGWALFGGLLLVFVGLTFGRGADLARGIAWFFILSGLLVLSLAIGWGVALWVILVFVLLMARAQHLQAERTSLLWMLVVAAEKQIPLGPAVEAVAWEFGGAMARRARQLAGRLARGYTLEQAVSALRALPPESELAIRVGSQTQRLGKALREAIDTRTNFQPLWNTLAGRTYYIAVILFAILATLLFIEIKLEPAFRKIMFDPGIDSPDPQFEWMTILVASMSQNPACRLVVILLQLFFIYGSLAAMGLVPFPWASRRLAAATVLKSLAIAMESGWPITRALLLLQHVYPRWRIRARLRRSLRDVETGIDWRQALRLQGLLKQAEVVLLESAQRAGNLPWACREVGLAIERRFINRCQSLLQATLPWLILFLGILVLFVALSVLIPIATLIRFNI
jgi:type II secretory pathway component PulF